MKKLIRGIVDFRKNVRPSYKETFAQLALGQRPDTLFIACSDSRVVPNLFASSNPGDLFVVRNVGNLVPPGGAGSSSDGSEAAAIEFVLLNLPITEIIVCGHSECGAMTALSSGNQLSDAPKLRSWLRHGEGALRRLEGGRLLDPRLERHNLLSQLNVLEQLEHLRTYPLIAARLKQNRLHLHAWWFEIRGADVYHYVPAEDRFRLIDEDSEELLAVPATSVPSAVPVHP